MQPVQIGYLIVTALLGGFIQASTGFGYAIFTMALWPMVLSVTDATMLEMIAVLTSILYLLVYMRKHINPKLLLIPVLVTNVFSLAGFAIQHHMPDGIIRRVLGMVLMLLSIYFLFYNDRIKIFATPRTAVLASTVAGILGGLCNISGPPMVLYYTAVCKSKEEYSGTMQAFFLFSVLVKLIYGLVNRLATPGILSLAPVLCLATIGGSVLGFLIFKRLPILQLKKMVYVLMICAGLYYLFF